MILYFTSRYFVMTTIAEFLDIYYWLTLGCENIHTIRIEKSELADLCNQLSMKVFLTAGDK